ncbi:MAG: aspartate/glutamate racemase family protein [Syntrophorhabdales bacterium]|jgi:allantoin racemase
MKILLANVACAPENSEESRFVKEALVPLWKRNFDLVRQKDTEIVARFPGWGIGALDGFFYSYIDALNSQSVFHAAVAAEKEGFDAVLIMCFGDPMLWQIRQAVNIPVVSLGESSILLAAMMGLKFGIVTISPYNIPETEHTIAKYGLEHRYAGARANSETGDEQGAAILDARHAIESFREAATELVRDGAEIIIPGCGLLSPALRLAPAAETEYPEGVTTVGGAAVMDVLSGALKTAETLVALKKAGSSWISRTRLFAQPTDRAREAGRIVLKDGRMIYWDVEL